MYYYGQKYIIQLRYTTGILLFHKKIYIKTETILQSLTIYLLVARIYKGELSTLPGIYFSECFRDFLMKFQPERIRGVKFHQNVEKTRGKVNSR